MTHMPAPEKLQAERPCRSGTKVIGWFQAAEPQGTGVSFLGTKRHVWLGPSHKSRGLLCPGQVGAFVKRKSGTVNPPEHSSLALWFLRPRLAPSWTTVVTASV